MLLCGWIDIYNCYVFLLDWSLDHYVVFFLISCNLYFKVYCVSYAGKAMAPHPSTLAWKPQWTEEPGRLQSMGSLGVRHNWVTSLSLFTFMHWRKKWQPTPVFLPGKSQGWGSPWAAVYGVAQSRTWLKRLSSSSSSSSFWYEDCYSSFLLLPICMEYIFPSSHFQSICVFRSEVGFLQTAHIWVLFFYPFSQSVSFGWSI